MRLLHANDSVGQHAESWYNATAKHQQYPQLNASIDTDVCVIGGGYTGLGAALQLAQAGVNVVVLEAHRVGWGASGRNGGQLGTGFNMHQDTLEKHLGKPQAMQLWQFCEDAKTNIQTICQQYNIDIEYAPGVVTALHRKRFVAEHHAYCNKLRDEYGYEKIQTLDKVELEAHVNSPRYFGGSIDTGAGHIHPLKLAQGLAKAVSEAGASIYELSQVNSIDYQSGNITTTNAKLNAKHIILACNGYIDELDPTFSKRVFPINNFMLATEPLGERAAQLLPSNSAVADSKFVVNYYRLSKDGRLLFGGGENYGYRFPSDMARTVRRAMLGVFPQLHDCKIDYTWGGTLAITANRLPVIRQVNERCIAAGGYSGHGVALSSMVGRAMGNAILGDSSTLELLENLPNRPFPGGPKLRPALQAMAMTAAKTLDFF